MPTATLPEIKLLKVGPDRKKKKRGGIAWLSESGKASGVMFAEGGSGAGTILQRVLGAKIYALLPKILVTGMVLGGGAGARALHTMVERDIAHRREIAPAMPAVFDAKAKDSGKAGDAGKTKDGDSTALLMREARDGKTDAQRAAEAAQRAADAKAQADADAKAKLDAEAAGKADEAAKSQAAEQSDKAKPGAADIASLQSGQLGGKSAIKGFHSNSGMGGDVHAASQGLTGWGFGKKMASADRLAISGMPQGVPKDIGMAALAPARTSAPLARMKGGQGRGLGYNQLNRATQLSAAAATSNNAETASQNAQNAFQPATGGDNSIGGPGGGGSTPADAAGSGNSSGSSGGGSGGGSQNQTPPDTSALGYCDTVFPAGGFVQSPGGGCVCPPGQDSQGSSCAPVHTSNATPWQPMVTAAKGLTMTVSALLAIATLLGVYANLADVAAGSGEILRTAAIALCSIAAVLAAIVTLLGMSISGYGGAAKLDGMTYTIVGGIMTAVAAIAAYNYVQTSAEDWEMNASARALGQLASGEYSSVAMTPIMAGAGGALAGGATASH